MAFDHLNFHFDPRFQRNELEYIFGEFLEENPNPPFDPRRQGHSVLLGPEEIRSPALVLRRVYPDAPGYIEFVPFDGRQENLLLRAKFNAGRVKWASLRLGGKWFQGEPSIQYAQSIRPHEWLSYVTWKNDFTWRAYDSRMVLGADHLLREHPPKVGFVMDLFGATSTYGDLDEALYVYSRSARGLGDEAFRYNPISYAVDRNRVPLAFELSEAVGHRPVLSRDSDLIELSEITELGPNANDAKRAEFLVELRRKIGMVGEEVVRKSLTPAEAETVLERALFPDSSKKAAGWGALFRNRVGRYFEKINPYNNVHNDWKALLHFILDRWHTLSNFDRRSVSTILSQQTPFSLKLEPPHSLLEIATRPRSGFLPIGLLLGLGIAALGTAAIFSHYFGPSQPEENTSPPNDEAWKTIAGLAVGFLPVQSKMGWVATLAAEKMLEFA